ncbi:hypothetical protein [Legionella spiritensis]|uniref:hypothetical protein n=1 Tax=Legionella spiritensis TaxID=452 RepID=UPI000F6CAECB|nr:hypothetical protein [Legionella spiritensis]VEG89753.1 Uncharacterised protein [Legionella spiritensis]
MVYIKRDKQGNVFSICEHGQPGDEQLDLDHPDVIAFLHRCEGEEKFKLLQSDLQLIRVVEDLIDVLISKNIITITDFPQSVIEKLLARQSFRKRLTGSIGMEFEDDQ